MAIELPTSYDEMLEHVEFALIELDRLYYEDMQRKGIRYGQMYINVVTPQKTWPELFHERDLEKCKSMIRENLINLQNGAFALLMVQTERKIRSMENPSGKSSFQQSAMKANPIVLDTTGSGTQKSEKSQEDSLYLRLLRDNGYLQAVFPLMRE